ncbi:SGNH/GDSL hydrolase family protein [Granulicella arctica]|uniref:hypothetical protein n=1 Tax=Granulicella arctica TaxID=940613 RepID=UPI0021DF72D6|nr:hypothetical protein [Granulicella arctica]
MPTLAVDSSCLKRSYCLTILIGFALLTGCTSYSNSVVVPVTTVKATPKWVVSWGASPENNLSSTTNQGGSEQSYRWLFSPTVAGTQERVHFSNFFGTTPLTIGAARLAVSTNDTAAIDTAHDSALTFAGAASVTIPPGGAVVSDPVNVTYLFGQKLAVSMYLTGTYGPLTHHNAEFQTSYVSPSNSGNVTGDASGAAFTQTTAEWFLLSEVDVYGPYQGTVVLFGSSSIDGHASNYGNANSYPVLNAPVAGQDSDRPSDWLARQLVSAGYNMGVSNAGVSADPAGPNSGATPAKGVADGIDREARDVFSQPGITTMITYIGAVDIKSSDCKSAPEVEASLMQIISAAAAQNIRVIVGTLPPSTFCQNSAAANFGPSPSTAAPYAGGATPGPINPGETQRMLVNTWIRSTAVNLPGVVGIADFAKVLTDPANPSFLIPNINSGDNNHPNGPGYSVQSSAIPLNLVLPPATN